MDIPCYKTISSGGFARLFYDNDPISGGLMVQLNGSGAMIRVVDSGLVTSSGAQVIASGVVADATSGLVTSGDLENVTSGMVTCSGAAEIASETAQTIVDAAAWYTIASSASILLNRTSGALQRVVLSGDTSIAKPMLTASGGTLLLDMTLSTDATITIDGSACFYQAGSYFLGYVCCADGVTRRINSTPELM